MRRFIQLRTGPAPKRLSKRQINALEQQLGRADPEAEHMGVPVYRSIEAAEEAKFPWLKARRRRR